MYLHAIILHAYFAGVSVSVSAGGSQAKDSVVSQAEAFFEGNDWARTGSLKEISDLGLSGFSANQNATSASSDGSAVKMSIGLGALGYSLTAVAAVALAALYGVYWVTRLVRCNLLSDNKVYIPEEQMTQRGFVFSRFGLVLKLLTYAFGIWLQVAMLMAIIGQYQDQWPFDLSLPPGAVDWDSFTRVFLSAWTASIVFAVLVRLYRKKMDSFYLRPSSLSVAKYVKLSQVMADSASGHHDISILHQEVLEVKETPIRHVNFLLRSIVWSDKEGMFVSGKFFDHAEPLGSELHQIKKDGGLSNATGLDRSRYFGRNEVVLKVDSLLQMTVSELATFFYMYQISAGCLLSLYWDYITAGLLSLILIVSSAFIKVVLERREKLQLKEIATLHGSVWVSRESHWTKVQSEELVVGDLICLSTESSDTCRDLTVDCVVVSGNAVVDESALTGETMPVQKFTAPSTNCYIRLNDDASVDWKKFSLFAGTRLLQGSGAAETERPSSITEGALAVVTSTGSSTMRGKLIRSLVYGSGVKSAFWAEYTAAMAVLVFLAGINFLIINTAREISLASILPAITSVVSLISPLLSVALLGGEIRSSKRLAALGIHTRDMHKLTIAGRTDIALLDKTGTITKSGLEFRGVIPQGSVRLCECLNNDAPVPLELSACVALAHSVSKCNGELVGHQVELRMVEAASRLGWKLDPDIRAPLDPGGNQWVVEKLFPFSHETMTMSAIVVQKSTGQRLVVCKGSFEALVPRCSSSSVTEDMKQAVGIYAQEGCYLLGAGVKYLDAGADAEIASRDKMESDLKFIGLILFRNEVKADSEKCIEELKRAGIDVTMVTGDSVFTACSVARSAGIISSTAKIVIGLIDQKTKLVEWRLADTDSLVSEETVKSDSFCLLAITGEVYELLKLSPDKLELERTKVFARVSPAQKADIVKIFSSSNHTVVMCGDGANDSLALRVAHAGLAISSMKAEASVAAPFSSNSDSLSALVTLVREARCAMTTSLAAYRFLIAVGLIQTISKTMLYLECGGFLSGVACLFIDCIEVPLMLYCICCAVPSSTLAPSVPEGSLMGPEMIFGVVWTLLTAVLTMGILEGVMQNSFWYYPFISSAPLSAWQERTDSFESSLVVLFRLWLYADVAFVYSYGSVHRQNVMKNWRLLIAVSLIAALIGYLLFGPVSVPQAAFVVQINEAEALNASSTFLNYFLFYYERVGGVWYGMTDSIEFPLDFRFGIVATFICVSALHHVGFRLGVLGPVGRWFHYSLKWWDGSCACCRRRRLRGYKPLKTQTIKFDALDESILHSADQDSPAAEWELRRTYGRWRAPAEPEYK